MSIGRVAGRVFNTVLCQQDFLGHSHTQYILHEASGTLFSPLFSNLIQCQQCPHCEQQGSGLLVYLYHPPPCLYHTASPFCPGRCHLRSCPALLSLLGSLSQEVDVRASLLSSLACSNISLPTSLQSFPVSRALHSPCLRGSFPPTPLVLTHCICIVLHLAVLACKHLDKVFVSLFAHVGCFTLCVPNMEATVSLSL